MTKQPPNGLSPERRQHIVEQLAAGNFFDTACRLAGTTKQTGHRWKTRGDKALEAADGELEVVEHGELVFAAFAKDCAEASAKAERDALREIRVAARDHWQAAAWFLERTKPEKYALRQKHEHAGPTGEPIRVSFASPTTPSDAQEPQS